ncbi:MAG: sugar transferase [Clostridia bacterium]|nr:sugar transferase [Clostridia bacterium]
MRDDKSSSKSLFYGISYDIIVTFSRIQVLLMISFVIAIFDRNGAVIYSHDRIGLHGVPFKMFKFRNMREGVNLEDVVSEEELEDYYKEYKLQNDPRITRIGGFLRKTSLDELPQLINILKGDMSFIGPRPVTYEETLFYGENRDELLSVKPGLTGYWQAYARNSVSYSNEKRQEMELYYVRNQSLRLDIKIFFKTIETVLLRKNAF